MARRGHDTNGERPRRAEKAGARLLHENEHNIYGDSPERVVDLITTVNSPAVLLPPTMRPTTFFAVTIRSTGWNRTREFTTHFHIKDWVAGAKHGSLAGEGQGRIAESIADAVSPRLRRLRDHGAPLARRRPHGRRHRARFVSARGGGVQSDSEAGGGRLRVGRRRRKRRRCGSMRPAERRGASGVSPPVRGAGARNDKSGERRGVSWRKPAVHGIQQCAERIATRTCSSPNCGFLPGCRGAQLQRGSPRAGSISVNGLGAGASPRGEPAHRPRPCPRPHPRADARGPSAVQAGAAPRRRSRLPAAPVRGTTVAAGTECDPGIDTVPSALSFLDCHPAPLECAPQRSRQRCPARVERAFRRWSKRERRTWASCRTTRTSGGAPPWTTRNSSACRSW